MINFIICEDNDNVRKLNEKIIMKSMFKSNHEFKIYSYKNYSKELEAKIIEPLGKKIYIIDIELGNISGIDIARKIRNYDWDSTIIFSTAHSELFPQIFKDRLLIFDFISKFDNYENTLKNAINEIIKINNFNKFLKFNIRKTVYNVRYKDILYLTYDKLDRKTILVTNNEKYKISKPMKSLSSDLTNNFIKINNHCIVNKDNIKKITSSGEILFINNKKIIDKITNKELISDVLV